MKSYTLYVRTLLAAGTMLLFSTVTAQEAVKLTDFGVSLVGETFVEQLFVHDGFVYTANRPQDDAGVGRFGVIDLESGAFVALADPSEYRGGYIPERYSGAFQEIEGRLFATTYGHGLGYEIYLLEGTKVTRLTQLAGAPLTELVSFQGAFYFLVRGRADGFSDDGEPSGYYTELWKTDGTVDGTVKEADLPILGNGMLGENPVTLVAGETALLVGGKALDQQVSGFQTLFLYRPGAEAAEVRVGAGLEFSRATLYSEFVAEGRNAYFSGGFYLAGLPFGGSDSRENVYRVDEQSGVLEEVPGLRDISFDTYLENEISFVVTEDHLYTHVAGAEEGFSLYRTTAASPLMFNQLVKSEDPSARISLKLHNGALYFGGSMFGQPGLVRYNITFGYTDRLFRTGHDAYVPFSVFPADNVTYLVPLTGTDVLYRYDFRSAVLSTFDRFETSPVGRADYLATLRGDDLVYLGNAENGQAGYTVPFILEAEAETPRIIADLGGGEELVGATSTLATLPGGEVLFAALPGSGGSVYHIYAPEDGAVRQLTGTSGLPAESFTYAGDFFGTPLFTAYSESEQRYRFYTADTSGFTPLNDPTASAQPSTGELSDFLETGTILDRSGQDFDIYDYEVSGGQANRRQIAGGSAEDVTIRRFGQLLAVTTTNAGDKTTTVYAEDRSELYTLQFAEDRQLLSVDAEGYFLLHFPPAGTPILEYGMAGGSTSASIPFPEGTTPEAGDEVIQLGDKLLLSPYSLTFGAEYFVANAADRSFKLLADIFPGSGGSLGGARILHGGILYFSANDGVHGTELWRTDGTPEGTNLVSDIFVGADYSDPAEFYVHAGSLYFRARGEAGMQAYTLDLLAEDAPVRLTDINPGADGARPYDFLGAESGLYFLARPATGQAYQLYVLPEPSTSTEPVLTVEEPVRVYPNPVADRLVIEDPAGVPIDAVELYDNSGRRLLTARTTSQRYEVGVSHLPRGTYFVHISYPNGRRITRPIVIAR